MLFKRQIISWLTIVVFFTSTTGFSIYEHICNISDLRIVAFSELFCITTIESEDSCCETNNPIPQEDCCDHEVSFNKYIPTGKVETQDFTITAPFFALLEKNNNWLEFPFKTISQEHSSSKAPNPNIHRPKSTSERLSFIQSYLC